MFLFWLCGTLCKRHLAAICPVFLKEGKVMIELARCNTELMMACRFVVTGFGNFLLACVGCLGTGRLRMLKGSNLSMLTPYCSDWNKMRIIVFS